MIRLLIADDNETLRHALVKTFLRLGFETQQASNGKEAMELANKYCFDLALIDIKMPEMDGMEVLNQLKKQSPKTRVLIMTGHASVESAVEALRQEAADYLIKPFSIQELESRIVSVLEKFDLLHQTTYAKSSKKDFPPFIGKSAKILKIKESLKEIANNNSPVFITGEFGTGKKLLAHEIHQLSERKQNPFVAINCKALPEALLEGEIFGSEKQTATGATVHKKGAVESNPGGTVLLDNIECLPPALQTRLDNFLKSQNDSGLVRIIATANEKAGNVLTHLTPHQLYLPPLRERIEDLPLLRDYFLEKYQGLLHKKTSFSSEAIEALEAYTWPGNVHELEHVIERAIVLALAGKPIGLEEFPTRILKK